MAKRSKADVSHAIDLLWSHQIRRENASLYQEVKRLQQQVASQILEFEKLRTFSESASTTANNAIACVEKALSDQTALQVVVASVNGQAQSTAERLQDLQSRLQDVNADQTQVITNFNRDIGKLRAEFALFEELHGDDLKEIRARLEQALSAFNDKSIAVTVSDLQHRVDRLGTSLVVPSNNESISRIEESVDEGCWGTRACDASPRIEPSAQSQPKTHVPPTPQVIEDAEPEVMLTLPDAANHEESTDCEEIDLDENVRTMSYAMNMRKEAPPHDSLVTIQEHVPNITVDNIEALKQGRFHSWERYFAEGQLLVRKVSRRHESDVVKRFVAGLFANKQREQCEEWLDVNGWTWKSIESFGFSATPSIPVHLEQVDQGRRKAGPLSNQLRCTNEQAKGNQEERLAGVRQSYSKRIGGPTEESEPLVPRRSQRLKQQSRISQRLLQPTSTQGTSMAGSQRNQTQSQKQCKKNWKRPRNAFGRFERLQSPSDAGSSKQNHSKVSKPRPKWSSQAKNKAQKSLRGSELSKWRASKPARRQHQAGENTGKRSERIDDQDPVLPSTPPRPTSPVGVPEDSVPRLVKREKGVGRNVGDQRGKKRRLVDTEELPPLADNPTKGTAHGNLKPWRRMRRLPLPPPPEIPIMPTSDD